MKNNIFIILSFGLFLMPLGAFAQVTAEECATYPGDSCPNGCVNPRGDAKEYCDICPETTYSNDGLRCRPCTKPNDAEFLTSYNNEYAGIPSAYECPWEITCPENQEISPSNWNYNTTCSKCSDGYHKPADQTQYWDGTTITGGCVAKNFIINPKLIIPKSSGNDTIELTKECSFTYTYNRGSHTISKTQDFKNKIFGCVDAYIKNKYNFPTGNQSFDLKYSDGRDTGYEVQYDDSNFVFKTDVRQIGTNNPNDTIFTMEITMVPKTYTLCYCEEAPNDKAANAINTDCYCENKNQFGTAIYAKSMTEQINEKFDHNCAGYYLNQWNGYIFDINNSGYLGLTPNKTFVINVKDTIPEPDTDSQRVILRPKFVQCPAGTYNNATLCPTECEICPGGHYSSGEASTCAICAAGTYSTAGATTCTPCPADEFSAAGSEYCSKCPDGFKSDASATSWQDCYIDSNMKFKDNNNSTFTLPNNTRAYYIGNQ